MAGRVEIHGGPADGATVAAGGKFEWIEVVTIKRAVRTPDCGLYELGPTGYRYIGGHTARCDCGTYYSRSDLAGVKPRCPICGGLSAVR